MRTTRLYHDNVAPKRFDLMRPVYLSLAQCLMRAVDADEVTPGTRLPPHRALAYQLGLSVQTISRAMGELRAAIDAGLVAPDAHYPELGDIIADIAPGRTSSEQITIADLTGTGVQDTAIATLARTRAAEMALGLNLES